MSKEKNFADRIFAEGPICELNASNRIRFVINEREHVEFEWGEYFMIGTAAYWVSQATQVSFSHDFSYGKSLSEEVVYCLLGGHGIPAEIGNAAFKSIKESGLICLNPIPTEEEIESVLRLPIWVPSKKYPIFYRFPKQKSRRIHAALQELKLDEPPKHPLALRKWLLNIPGIGLKTASWIVRNHLNSDLVAIIDIHIQRAGIAAGFFKKTWSLPKDYELFEKSFLAYAKIGGVPATVLDACIWDQMHHFGRLAKSLLPHN